MPPGEISVTCPGCENRMSVPIAAARRNNYYCSKCGKAVPLNNVSFGDNSTEAARARPKKSSRPYRR